MDTLQHENSVKDVYIFVKGSWWDSNGCSCCEPMEMIYFNCDKVPHTVYTEDGCYTAALEQYFDLDPVITDLISQCHEEDLKEALANVGVRVIIDESGYHEG